MFAILKLILLTFLFQLSLPICAQDIDKEEYKYLGSVYQQDKYELDDPLGDILLLWTNSQIPKIIFETLKGKQHEIIQERKEKIAELLKIYPEFSPKEETKNILVDNYVDLRLEDFPIELEGHKAPFKIKNLTSMMKEVIFEEYKMTGIEPRLGTIHKWSPQIHKKLKKKFIFLSRFSKLLMALCRGSTSQFMITGKENLLADYLLTRKENSVTLEEMFRSSYRINEGDVYLSLLTIENLLSRYWHTPKRSKRLLTTKLKDITNYNYRIDKFGSWYHLFGIMLYGYAEGGFKATVVGKVESIGSQLMSRFEDEKQEDFINRRGGRVGNRLRKFITNQEYKHFIPNQIYLDESFYLQLNEDFQNRIKQ
jgi:hypothetical protein